MSDNKPKPSAPKPQPPKPSNPKPVREAPRPHSAPGQGDKGVGRPPSRG
ncbi:hypothetical protein [Pedobacter aquatilis]|nr:hypothetical protein [Pedobacter aquatilis]